MSKDRLLQDLRNMSGPEADALRRRSEELAAKHDRNRETQPSAPASVPGQQAEPPLEIEPLKRARLDLSALQLLLKTGISVMGELKKCLDGWGEFFVVENSAAHQLRASFFGLRLIFSLELVYGKDEVRGKVAAHYLSYEAEPNAQPLVEYSFDRLGNMSQRTNTENFAPYFLADVFEKIRAQKLVLRPGFVPEERVGFAPAAGSRSEPC